MGSSQIHIECQAKELFLIMATTLFQITKEYTIYQVPPLLHEERSRKLFEARISALFCFFFFIFSSILRRKILINFQKAIDILSELRGAFCNGNTVTKRALVIKKCSTKSQLQGGIAL